MFQVQNYPNDTYVDHAAGNLLDVLESFENGDPLQGGRSAGFLAFEFLVCDSVALYGSKQSVFITGKKDLFVTSVEFDITPVGAHAGRQTMGTLNGR